MKDICAQCLMPLGNIIYLDYIDGDYYALHERCLFNFRMSKARSEAMFKSLDKMFGFKDEEKE